MIVSLLNQTVIVSLLTWAVALGLVPPPGRNGGVDVQ